MRSPGSLLIQLYMSAKSVKLAGGWWRRGWLQCLHDEVEALERALVHALRPHTPTPTPRTARTPDHPNRANTTARRHHRQEFITQDELDELEAVEEWISAMVDVDEAQFMMELEMLEGPTVPTQQ